MATKKRQLPGKEQGVRKRGRRRIDPWTAKKKYGRKYETKKFDDFKWSQETVPQSSFFLGLPFEIREKIYEYSISSRAISPRKSAPSSSP